MSFQVVEEVRDGEGGLKFSRVHMWAPERPRRIAKEKAGRRWLREGATRSGLIGRQGRASMCMCARGELPHLLSCRAGVKKQKLSSHTNLSEQN